MVSIRFFSIMSDIAYFFSSVRFVVCFLERRLFRFLFVLAELGVFLSWSRERFVSWI